MESGDGSRSGIIIVVGEREQLSVEIVLKKKQLEVVAGEIGGE